MASHTVVIVGCRRCLRRGRYNLPRLVDRYGADFEPLGLAETLSADCPKKRDWTSIYDRCGIYFPGAANKRLRAMGRADAITDPDPE